MEMETKLFGLVLLRHEIQAFLAFLMPLFYFILFWEYVKTQ